MNTQKQHRSKVTPARPTDDIAQEPILEIQHKDTWLVVSQQVFDSWTGLRRQNGKDFHGVVRPMHMPDKVWTGSRVCRCATCQANVEAKYRPN